MYMVPPRKAGLSALMKSLPLSLIDVGVGVNVGWVSVNIGIDIEGEKNLAVFIDATRRNRP